MLRALALVLLLAALPARAQVTEIFKCRSADGHWTYTNDWGWFWISDEDFGWVTYHYGRWVDDREFGWIWIPRSEWGPAWVQWRRSDDVVGWAALPPDDVVVEYRESPRYWA